MATINHLQGYAFAKKKGDRIDVFEGPHTLMDFAPVIADGTDVPRMLKDPFADVVNVKDFGAKGDGVTDDTAAIQAAIDSHPGAEIVFPEGSYLVRTTIQTTCDDSGVPYLCLAKSATLLAASNFVGDYVVHLGAYGTGASSYSGARHRIGFCGGRIDGNGVANGLFSENTHCAHLHNFDVINAKQVGVRVGPAYGTASSADAYVYNVNALCANSDDADSVGFWIDAYDCDVSDIRAGSFVTGVRMLKGGYCANAHPIYGNMGSVYNSSVGFDISGTVLTDCYADNFSTAIQQNGSSKWGATNFTAYWYTNTNHNHTVIKVIDSDQFSGYVDGLSITIPESGTNRGIWIDGKTLNQYCGSVPQMPHIYNLKIDEAFWKRLTYRLTDPIFDNQIRDIYEYGLGNIDSSLSAYKTGYWYPVAIVQGVRDTFDFQLCFGNVLAVSLSMSISDAGISFLREQIHRNYAGSKISLRIGNVFDYANAVYRVIYFRFDSHVKSFSRTYLTVKINQNTFHQRYIIPIRAAHNYDDRFKGLLEIDNPVGDIVSLDLGEGAQEDHRPLSRFHDYSESHSIPILDSNRFQRMFANFGSTDQCYLIRGSTVKLLYSSDKPDPTPVTIQMSGDATSGYTASAAYQEYVNPVTWETNADATAIDFTFPSSSIVQVERY